MKEFDELKRVLGHFKLRKKDISITMIEMFIEVCNKPGISITELAQRTYSDPSYTSQVTIEFERLGIFSRLQDKKNLRRKNIHLGDEGQKLRKLTQINSQ